MLFFRDVLDASSCGSSFCKNKSTNSSKITYQTFTKFHNTKLDIMTPIRKINTSTSQICMGNCSVESYCTSINFSWELGEDNCELLSENAYENHTELVHLTSWRHYTTYVSSTYIYFYYFSCWLRMHDICSLINHKVSSCF